MALVSSLSAPVTPAGRTELVPAARWSGRTPSAAAAARPWRRRWTVLLIAGDGIAVALALAAGAAADPGGTGPGTGRLAGTAAGCLVGAAWLAALGLAGCYRTRHLGTGAEEYRRVAAGTCRLWAAGLLAAHLGSHLAAHPGSHLGSHLGGAGILGGPLTVAPPLGLALLLAGRGLARRRLVTRRLRGHLLHRVVLVGDPLSAAGLAATLRRERAAGLDLVGVCAAGPGRPLPGGLPMLGALDDVPAVVATHRADTVLVVAPDVPPDAVRRLCWALEGSAADVLVAPGMAGVVGPRLSVRPVAGLPLLHVDQPEFTGCRRWAKDASDRVLAALGLVLLGPLLLAVGAAVRLTSSGPALFVQPRCGRGGERFDVYKFRTMYADAEVRLTALSECNESDGLLFKIRHDPRVTPLGRLLRRSSLDELPQLLNVLRGQMSLVGPRPLPVADRDFTGDERRRLLVRPGITGLWQVSGRSSLSWQDAVRLDLYYVENWSLGLDLSILLRTGGAVIRGVGAY